MDRSEKIKILDNLIFECYENERLNKNIYRKSNEINIKENMFLEGLSEDKVKEYRKLYDLVENYNDYQLSDKLEFAIGLMLDLFGK